MSPAGGPRFTGEKSTTRPYLFLKAPSCLAGAYDDIEIPLGMSKIDWEAEIALAIGKQGKRIKAERALEHVAGFMTTNDVSCRDLQIRTDRPALRSDWLGGKSHDNFAPIGPFLVPRAFVPVHMTLFIRLTVNGEVKQNGNTSQFIFTPEEQIEYASGILTLEPGDIFSCGTCGGVGQGTNTFLKIGDVMETEGESLGKMENRFVAETPLGQGVDRVHQGWQAAGAGSTDRDALGDAARPPNRGRVRAGLRDQPVVWRRRSQEHTRGHRRQAQQRGQCRPRRSQDQGAAHRLRRHGACGFAR